MRQYILGIPGVLGVLGLSVLLAHHDHPNKTKFMRLVVHQKNNLYYELIAYMRGLDDEIPKSFVNHCRDFFEGRVGGGIFLGK